MTQLTQTQFDALAQLLRLRAGPSRVAAELVFVGGLSQADAARQSGCSTAAVGNVVRSVRKGLVLANTATTRGNHLVNGLKKI